MGWEVHIQHANNTEYDIIKDILRMYVLSKQVTVHSIWEIISIPVQVEKLLLNNHN